MNFFDQQSAKRRQSLFLLIFFIAAFIATGIVIHVVIAGLSIFLGESTQMFDLSTPAVTLIGLVWVMIFLGALFRTMDVKSGAAKLAMRFGAVQVSDCSRDENEQQLLNVVAEISIASSTPQPDVYVLRRETSINAFVLGSAPRVNQERRHVLVITQGALDHFDRDELKAVVAHEYGHISNGDITVNMNLLIALGGLMAIDEVGRLLVGKNPDNNFHPGVIAGCLLRVLGSIGVFFGQLIRCAFSRQREYLADACALQFTRNPYALASALNIIKLQNEELALHSIHEQELAHLCFQSGKTKRWLDRLFASHPKLQNRIDAIDPYFGVKHHKARKAKMHMDERVSVSGGDALSDIGFGVTSEPIVESVLSDGAQIMLSDTPNSMAVLFAIFISDDANNRRDYFNAAAFAFNRKFAVRIKELSNILSDEMHNNQLALIVQATKTICASASLEDRHRLLVKLEGLVSAADDFNLMNYASLQLIRRKLKLEFPLIKTMAEDHSAQGRHVKKFDSMGSEFALLLSLIVESSGASEALQNQEFVRVLKCYTASSYPRRSKKEKGIVLEVSAAFQTLYVQPKPVREAFLQHCIEIVRQDGFIARAERALLDLFAASLGCQQKPA
jgi:Zn-dependent protease with chaperone function